MSQLWGFHHPEPAVPDSAPDTAAPRGAIYTGWHPQTNMNCFSLRGGTLTGVHTTAHASVADASRFFIEVLPHDLGVTSYRRAAMRSRKLHSAPPLSVTDWELAQKHYFGDIRSLLMRNEWLLLMLSGFC